jgi:hypothetical protein
MSAPDLTEMYKEIGTAVSTGHAPFLGQAINIYDTIESLIALHDSKTPAAKEEAQFDLVLAIVGWIPGAGGGVKKTIRLINFYPGHAPNFFDFLRNACAMLEIHTSPVLLLDKLFDTAALTSLLGAIKACIEKSWMFEQMPPEQKAMISSEIDTVRLQLPALMMLVTTKLAQWMYQQRNNTARNSPPSHAAEKKVASGMDNSEYAAGKTLSATKGNNSTHFVELNFHWPDLTPVAGAPFRAVFSNGSVAEGRLDSKGFARLEDIPEGTVLVYFGEDPRPYSPPPFRNAGPTTLTAVRTELQMYGFCTEIEDIETVLEYMAGRDLQ